MTYDIERARQPATAGGPDLAKEHTPPTPHTEPASAPHQPGTSADAPGLHEPAMMLSQGDRGRLALRLQQALNTFVESPHQAVQDADGVFDEAITHLTDVLTERRRTLRENWQDKGTEVQTEELRLALLQYQETTERVLRT